MLAAIVTAAHKNGAEHQVLSLLPGGAIADRLRGNGISVGDLGMAPRRPDIFAVGKLARWIRRAQPDVIQSWMYHADLMATLALVASGRRARTRLCWGVRCSTMELDKYGWQLRTVIRLCAVLSRVPDVVIANSEAGRDAHIRYGYQSKSMCVVDNGIDTERFRPDPEARRAVRGELGIDDERFVVALVARVDPMKNHDGFLRAMAELQGIAAIVVAGRSASAYTAEIGTMKITEEIDAMRTMGFEPFQFLVLPRVFALILSMPLIVFFADMIGVFGGMIIARLELGISFTEFLERLHTEVQIKHILIGLIKAPFFGFVIAAIGAFRGFQVTGSTDSVGHYTTVSVVNAIFWVIASNAFISVLLTELGI